MINFSAVYILMKWSNYRYAHKSSCVIECSLAYITKMIYVCVRKFPTNANAFDKRDGESSISLKLICLVPIILSFQFQTTLEVHTVHNQSKSYLKGQEQKDL